MINKYKTLNVLELFLKKDKLLSYPLNLMMLISNKCNLTCIHCPIYSPFSKKNKITINNKLSDSFYQNFSDAFTFSESVIINGEGEPLLADNFQHIVRNLSNAINLVLMTNGTLLHSYPLYIYKHISKMIISIDIPNFSGYRLLKGGNLQTVINNIKAIKNSFPNIDIVLSMIITKYSIPYLNDFYKLCKYLDIHNVVLREGVLSELIMSYNLDEDDYKILLEFYNTNNDINISFSNFDNMPSSIETFTYNIDFTDTVLDTIIDTYTNELINNIDLLVEPYCYNPWAQIFINPDNINCCCNLFYDSNNPLSNNFDDNWNGILFSNLRKQMYDRSLLSEKCIQCPKKDRHLYRERYLYFLEHELLKLYKR